MHFNKLALTSKDVEGLISAFPMKQSAPENLKFSNNDKFVNCWSFETCDEKKNNSIPEELEDQEVSNSPETDKIKIILK